MMTADSGNQADRDDTHLNQDWKGMDGAIAWHLIERHAEGWAQVGEMMHAWLEANKE
jgi:hypothetical protein